LKISKKNSFVSLVFFSMSLDLDFNGKREVVINQLKEGDILEDRYKVLNFQKDCGLNLPSGNVWDLKDEKMYVYHFF